MTGLLLAAFPPELADLRDDPPPGWQMACTGIGALQAALATAHLLEEHRPDRVIFLGTCGAYDDRLPLLSCLWASEAIATSLSEARREAYRPAPERVRWAATLDHPRPDAWPLYPVAVPPAITRTFEGAALLAPLAPAEHLELTGIFAACHQAQIPVGAALTVANRVGPQAHDEWKNHHAQASRGLVEQLRPWL